jgi:hypothetical protein
MVPRNLLDGLDAQRSGGSGQQMLGRHRHTDVVVLLLLVVKP